MTPKRERPLEAERTGLDWMTPGREVSLATRHGKERAMARPFRKALGTELVLAAGFDTDSLGSFSGERPRPADAETTCRLKAEAGMDATGLTLGLASEGSFGPHPSLPFLPLAIEWMTWVDRDRNLVITERLVGCRTNFAHCSAAPGAELGPWLDRIGFPTHAVIVRPHQAGAEPFLRKGLRAEAELRAAIEQASRRSADGLALVETDMRAHRNPTRMAAIRRLAFLLVRRIASACPACTSPGWGRVDVRSGLPCSWCGSPTPLVRHEVFGCVSCSHTEERPRPDGLGQANPQHCPLCNP
ncbi:MULTISPECIES: DUF6671 family protein [unclassified Synechococcus]|uniref:DUF6671 family protein n=1 Tax=unclassified Synechococcus TaxID=2626047 RepID=UPI0020CF03FC|nr:MULTISPECIES: DUF6671 family protein [unclassified Synechococcus]